MCQNTSAHCTPIPSQYSQRTRGLWTSCWPKDFVLQLLYNNFSRLNGPSQILKVHLSLPCLRLPYLSSCHVLTGQVIDQRRVLIFAVTRHLHRITAFNFLLQFSCIGLLWANIARYLQNSNESNQWKLVVKPSIIGLINSVGDTASDCQPVSCEK